MSTDLTFEIRNNTIRARIRIRRRQLGEVIFDKTASGAYRWTLDEWTPGQAWLWGKMKQNFADFMEEAAKFLGSIDSPAQDLVREKLSCFKPGLKYMSKVESCVESITVTFYDIT